MQADPPRVPLKIVRQSSCHYRISRQPKVKVRNFPLVGWPSAPRAQQVLRPLRNGEAPPAVGSPTWGNPLGIGDAMCLCDLLNLMDALRMR